MVFSDRIGKSQRLYLCGKDAKADAVPVSWQGIITGYGEGLIFIHEKLNEVEMKAYFDLLYQAGAKNVVYADESVKGIPEGTPWEDVIWGMKNTYKNLRFAVEITKEQPMDYLRYSLAQLAENCKRWGLEEEMSKLYM